MIDYSLSEIITSTGLEFSLNKIPYNIDYKLSILTRATTNYANFARDNSSTDKIELVLKAIELRLNQILTTSSSPALSRYSINLFINRISARFSKTDNWFPITEMMGAEIKDNITNDIYKCSNGFNLSSYVRDYDFNIILKK